MVRSAPLKPGCRVLELSRKPCSQADALSSITGVAFAARLLGRPKRRARRYAFLSAGISRSRLVRAAGTAPFISRMRSEERTGYAWPAALEGTGATEAGSVWPGAPRGVEACHSEKVIRISEQMRVCISGVTRNP